MPVIYKITSPSNRIYIGQSWRWLNRKSDYRILKCEGQGIIYKSLLKYGFDNHIVEIQETLVETCTQTELDDREIYWWKYYKDLGFEMMNIKYPGSRGKHSEESRKKMSLCHIGQTWSEESKLKYKETRKRTGYKHPPEVMEKIKASLTGKVRTAESIKRISNAQKGLKRSKESTAKMIATKREMNKPYNEKYKNLFFILKRIVKNKARRKSDPKICKKVINTSTNEIYGSIKIAAMSYNMIPHKLRNRLRGYVKNNTPFQYLDDV